MVSETDRFLKNLLTKGLIYERKVYRENSGSGKINVHKSLIGKKFRIIIIPLEEGEYGLEGKRPKPDDEGYRREELEKEIKLLKEKLALFEKVEEEKTVYPPKPTEVKIDFSATEAPQK